MQRLTRLLILVGTVQLTLGALYLLVPHQMLGWMGHSPVSADIAYPFGMLASRFIIYGLLLLLAARNPTHNRLLIVGMVGIQLIDAAVGIFYSATGVIGLSLSGFPIFNAIWIGTLLWAWRPKEAKA